MIRYTRDPVANIERAPLADVLGYETSGSKHGSSRWKRLRGCPREEKLVQLRIRKEGVVNDALDFGTLYHLGLETYYRALMTGASRRDAIVACWSALDIIKDASGYEKMYADLDRTLTGYFEYAAGDQWDILAVEVELCSAVTSSTSLTIMVCGRCGLLQASNDKHMCVVTNCGGVLSPVPAPDTVEVPYSARLDLFVRDRATGGLWVVEHKTASRYTEDLVVGYQADMQTLGQAWLVHKNPSPLLASPFMGVLVNIAVKPLKTKPAQYFRVEVRPSKYHLDEFEKSLVAWAHVARAMEEAGWPKALGSCAGPVHYFKQCTYFDLCHNDAGHFDPLSEFAPEDVPYGYKQIQNENKEQNETT